MPSADPPPTAASDLPVVLAVLAGGCAGGLARHGLTLALPAGGTWPWGVVVANTAGAFLLAVLLVRLRSHGPAWLLPAVGTGLLGAFTTMSGVAAAAVVAADDGEPLAALLLVGLSAVVGLAAAAAGLRVAGRR